MNARLAPLAPLAGAGRLVAAGVFFASLLSLGTGCGALKAAANPKSAWALGDPAPMAVVVRRADAAEGTGKEVDRLLTTTAASPEAGWVKATALTDEEQKKHGDALANHSLYVKSQARIVAAELWVRALPERKSDGAKPEGKPDTKAAAEADGSKSAAPTKTAKADKPGKKKGRKSAAAPTAIAQADKPSVGTATLTGADVPTVRAGSLLAAIDAALAEQYAGVMAKKKELGEMKAQIAAEEAAADEKGVSEGDKKAHKEKAAQLEKTADAAEAEADKRAKEFVPAAKAAAQKASTDAADKYGATLIALKQAVADANLANSAAAMKYPLALPTLKDSAMQMVGVYVADVIEEKTGTRPDLASLQPGVTLENGDVKVTLNGLTPAQMGKLDIGALTKEVASRTTKWVKHAVLLMGTISASAAILGFEDDVLGALVDGFAAAGWKAPPPPQLKEPTPAKPGQSAAPKA